MAKTNANKLRISTDDDGLIDEVVIGQWLHIERMDSDTFCVQVADQQCMVRTRRDGRAAITSQWDSK